MAAPNSAPSAPPVGIRAQERFLPGAKPRDLWGSLKRLWAVCGKERWKLVVVFLIATAGSGFALAGPLLIGRAVDAMARAGGVDFPRLVRTLVLLAAAYGGGALLTWLQEWWIAGVAQRVVMGMRRALFANVQGLPLSYFDQHPHGELMSRLSNDVDNVSTLLSSSTTQFFSSVLMLAGLREVLIISTPHDLPQFRRLLGDGSQLGMRIDYAEQPSPDGLAQAFIIGRDFLAGNPACLILGDNLFYGQGFTQILQRHAQLRQGSAIFAYYVRDPERFGVIEFDESTGKALSLEEKPKLPRSTFAVPGLYFYDSKVCELAASMKPSMRGELEITDLNRLYLELGELSVEKLGRGFAWLDTGTHRSLIEAANYIEAIEERQGLKIACLEEIAWENGWIGRAQIEQTASAMGRSNYAEYLRFLLESRR